MCLSATVLSTHCLYSSLLDGDTQSIKEHLIDELDYILVPTEGWNKLLSWYGLTENQEPISRKVRPVLGTRPTLHPTSLTVKIRLSIMAVCVVCFKRRDVCYV